MARLPTAHVRHHASPRISANELAHYMVAGETGRIGIIRRAREAKTAITTRYSRVRDDIIEYLCDIKRSKSTLAALQNKYEVLATDPTASNWALEDARLSQEVLKALGRMENKIAGLRFIKPPSRQAPLSLSGVTVSVSLNLLQIREKNDRSEVGGILFRLTKADEETEAAATKRREIGAYSATLAFMQTHENVHGSRTPHHQLCASFDIQCSEVHAAPRTFATKAKELENACRFIAAMWNDA